MDLSFIRHAESVYNADSTSTERNCGLTIKGIKQAQDLQVGPFDWVIVSPMRRCRETFQHSAVVEQISVENVETLDVVREHKINACDFFPEEDATILEDEEEVLARCDQLREHATELFQKFKDEKKEVHVGIFTHSDFVWYFTSEVHEESGERFGVWLANAESHTVKFDVTTKMY
jgi:broad specificity phosphatase PhoE